jgi:hypothetical protein
MAFGIGSGHEHLRRTRRSHDSREWCKWSRQCLYNLIDFEVQNHPNEIFITSIGALDVEQILLLDHRSRGLLCVEHLKIIRIVIIFTN